MTILFADVAGSTALGEALEPEDMPYATRARCERAPLMEQGLAVLEQLGDREQLRRYERLEVG